MTSGSLAGWGESSPLAAPCYSPEWAGGVFAVAKEWLAPALVGQTIASGDELQQRLAHFKGNPFAKAALDTRLVELAAPASPASRCTSCWPKPPAAYRATKFPSAPISA